MKLKHHLAATIIAVLLLLSLMIYGFLQMKQSEHASFMVHHTISAINKIQVLTTELNEMDNSQRGFIITSKERFSNNFTKSSHAFTQNLYDLKKFLGDNVDQIKKIDELENKFHVFLKNHTALSYCLPG